jgi:hypothetical protein
VQHRLPSGAGRARGAVHHRRATAGELAALDSDSGLRRKLREHAAPEVLLIDEVGDPSHSNRRAEVPFTGDTCWPASSPANVN